MGNSSGLAKLNGLKADARFYGIEFPKTITTDELEKLVDAAKAEAESKLKPCDQCGHKNWLKCKCSNFDEINPELEGDHLPEAQPEPATVDETREGWLNRAVVLLAPLLRQVGAPIDPSKIRVS